MSIFNICSKFGIIAVAQKEITKGLINNTSLVCDTEGHTYILQEINSFVFKDIKGLMENIDNITKYLKLQLIKNGGDPTRETLSLIPCGESLFYQQKDSDGKMHYYRMYKNIENAVTYDIASKDLLYKAGKGFGRFQKLLTNYPASTLNESIKDFHNTPKRLKDFEEILKRTNEQTLDQAENEIIYLLQNKKIASIITDALKSKTIPVRVSHNDTKLNNVMLDEKTGEALCVIDLDTIMAGSVLYDYGDAIRYSANLGTENDTTTENVGLDKEKFLAFTDGFLSELYDTLSANEIALLSKSVQVLTYELAIRFLSDYLQGNKYFKCDSKRPLHNLERARVQIKLLDELKKNEEYMNKEIEKIYKKYAKSTENLIF